MADTRSPHCDGHTGVLVSWSDGSLFFEGISTTEVAKDYFMFNAVEGGALVREPEIGIQGSNSLFMNGQFDWMM